MTQVRIKALSVMGWPVWVTGVSEPIDTGEGMAPIVSMINREHKGKLFSPEEAAVLLPQVHTCHPEAEIVSALFGIKGTTESPQSKIEIRNSKIPQ